MNVAIYAKDVTDAQMADLRAWVVSQGFTGIVEYRDVTPIRGRSGDKEFRRMVQDAQEGKLECVFINSIEQAGLIELTLLMTIIELKRCGVRLISRKEPWTDLSIGELAIVFQAYCLHAKSEAEMVPRTRRARTHRRRAKKPKTKITDFVKKCIHKCLYIWRENHVQKEKGQTKS